MNAFLSMGGYGWYVWMSYGAVALAVLAESVIVRNRHRRARLGARAAVAPEAPPAARFHPAPRA